MENTNARWAFNTAQWRPTYDELMAASSYIQEEEIERVSRFVFQQDAKSSLIGRLMLRKYIHGTSSIPYQEIRLGRDGHGKPYLMGAGDMTLWFNVSHQGDFVVLAGNTSYEIGVDVMKIEPPINKNIPEFFRLMTRQFSNQEWPTIRSFPTEMEQIGCFYRNWCLKESYVKNTGVGITIPLQDISFNIKTRKLDIGIATLDTELYLNGVLQNEWVFEETLLDKQHTAAVSIRCKNKCEYVPTPYTYLNFEELVKDAKPMHVPNSCFSDAFMKKNFKPF